MRNLLFKERLFCVLSLLFSTIIFNVNTTRAQFPFMNTVPQNKKTYLYAWKKRWNNKENVWVKGDNKTVYYTFTNNNCYRSDKDGFSDGHQTIYQYYGKKDGQIYYFYNIGDITHHWVVVTEDYKTLTMIDEFLSNGHVFHDVYEKTIPSSGKKFPNVSPQSNSSSNNNSSIYTPSSPQIRSTQGNYNSNSNSLKSSSDRYTCGMCNGTGKCKHCGGKGVRWNKYSDTWDACPYCNGANGICKWCNGKGYKTY